MIKHPVSKEEKRKRTPRVQKEVELYRFNVHKPLPLLEYLLVKLPTLGRNKIKSFLTHKQVLVDGMVVLVTILNLQKKTLLLF